MSLLPSCTLHVSAIVEPSGYVPAFILNLLDLIVDHNDVLQARLDCADVMCEHYPAGLLVYMNGKPFYIFGSRDWKTKWNVDRQLIDKMILDQGILLSRQITL